MTTIELDGDSLTLAEFATIATTSASCRLAAGVRDRIAAGRRAIDDLPRDRPVYGVNTGFGDLASVHIEPDQIVSLQRRLLHSHAAGMGEPLPEPAVRGMLPKNRLGRAMLRKLKVYPGPEHGHAAQQPTPLEIKA